jgi:hypothetical protein
MLSNEKEKSIEFIDRYISDENRTLEIFIEKLVKNWKGFWEYIYNNNSYSTEKVNTYLRLVIKFSNVETILKNQNNELLKETIEKNPRFLSLINESEELYFLAKIAKLFEQLEIKFKKLDNPTEENRELFDFVYRNSNYEINIGNLMQMFELYNEKENLFETSNYSTIQNSNCKPLIEYVNSEINLYVKNVYLKLEQNKFEEEESLKRLLNNEKLEGKLIFEIIEKVETKISDLSTINNKIDKGVLLKENKVVPEWNNIVDYYVDCENTIDKELVKFLNFENVYSILANEKMPQKSETFNYSTFRENLLLCNDISDESYKNILKNNLYKRDSLAFEVLNTNKAIYLIDKILNTTKVNYDLLREFFTDYHITLIEKDFNRFIENIDDFETDEVDILLILNSQKISIDNRFKYISKLSERIIVDNKDIAKRVGEFIIQKSIKIDFEFDAINSIVKNSILYETKVRLINLYFSDLSNDDIISLVKNMNWEYSKLFKKGRPTFLNRDYNNKLFENLKSKQIIKNYYPDSWNEDQIRVTTKY